MKHRCPICHKIVKASTPEQSKQAKFFPFCSQRCKLIDLGSWLDGKYKIDPNQHIRESGKTSDNSPNTYSDKE